MRRLVVLLAVLAGACGLSACSTVGYYYQAARGQFEIFRTARPIGRWLADPATSADLRTRLEAVRSIRRFASSELGLPDNGSYRDYADLHRPFVVWNVVAAPEFSTRPHEWCFPFAGCVRYKGWFHEQAARTAAGGLAAQGFDVFVYGVPAYSTLGWFDDPVLNTFIRYPRPEIARMIFHELAHQLVYVPGDSTFNESFATAVEREGVRRWLARDGTEAERRTAENLSRYRQDFLALVQGFRGELDALYASPLDPARMRVAKAEAFRTLAGRYEALKRSWGGFAGYDRWFAPPLGNAHVASVATYTDWLPAFDALLAREHGDLPRFYDAVRQLASASPDVRRERLADLAGR
ncbi:MAG: aminopeptidase [Betaproteobacteria bacterium]|nr:aminopeptidase [Betaproteobacteria bacterium]